MIVPYMVAGTMKMFFFGCLLEACLSYQWEEHFYN